MKKKKNRKRWIILIVVLVIVVLVVVWFMNMRAGIEALAKTTYEITDVQEGTIEVKVKGAGAVEPLVDETVYASFAGTVAEVSVEDGDVVAADDVVAVFTSDALDTEKESIEQQIEDIDTAIGSMRSTSGNEYVRSPIEGTVKIVYAAVDDTVDIVVEKYGALAVVCPDDLMQAVIPISADVVPGDNVMVTVGEDSAQGVVYAIDAQGGEMTVRFDDDDYDVDATVVVSTEDGMDIGTGVVAIANPVYIMAKGGVVEHVYEDAGDSVSRGGKLFRLDGEILSDELYTQIEARGDLEADLEAVESDIAALTVYAGADGVVSGLSLNKEQIVQEGTALFTVESNNQIKIDVEIDELDIANIAIGQEADVEFDALPDRAYTAKVLRINPIGVAVNNVTNFTITLEIEQAPEILLGMSADVEIISQRAENVLLIPIEAIQIIDGKKYVVFEEDINEELMYTTATHKIATGITDGVMIEVTEGLGVGDRVAVPQTKVLDMQAIMMRNSGNNPFE